MGVNQLPCRDRRSFHIQISPAVLLPAGSLYALWGPAFFSCAKYVCRFEQPAVKILKPGQSSVQRFEPFKKVIHIADYSAEKPRAIKINYSETGLCEELLQLWPAKVLVPWFLG